VQLQSESSGNSSNQKYIASTRNNRSVAAGAMRVRVMVLWWWISPEGRWRWMGAISGVMLQQHSAMLA